MELCTPGLLKDFSHRRLNALNKNPGKVVAVTMKVEAKETVITPAGTFQTIRVQPTADAGVVKNRGSILIWYSDDARHLPVQVTAHLFWGTITMRLTNATNK